MLRVDSPVNAATKRRDGVTRYDNHKTRDALTVPGLPFPGGHWEAGGASVADRRRFVNSGGGGVSTNLSIEEGNGAGAAGAGASDPGRDGKQTREMGRR